MELHVWSGDWSIPSVNPQCLAVMAYTKFSKAPISISTTNNPWSSPTGQLPVLRHDGRIMTDIQEMFNYFREHNYGCEHDLSVSDSADMLAFVAMVEKKLVPAINHLFWIDAKAYSEVTRPWYGKAVKLPLSLYYPNRYHNDITTEVLDCHPNLSEDDIATKVYREARECINHLSAKLGNSDYFFGANPTALDAIVYGQLAPLLKAPLHANTLTGHLKAIDNLQGLIRRINYRYFSKEIELASSKEEAANKESLLDFEQFPNKKRNIFLSSLVALAAMTSYAFLSGLVEVDIRHEDESADDLDDDE